MRFNLKKLSQEKTVRGPAVDAVIDVVNDMYGRGAPVVYDNQGFNQNDYPNPDLHRIAMMMGQDVPISLIVDTVMILSRYKNTQITNFDQLAFDVQQLINQASGMQTPTSPLSSAQGTVNNVVTFVGQEYGIPIFHIPGLGKKTVKITRAIKTIMSEKGEDAGDAWKKFYRSKKGIDFFRVDTEYLEIVKSVLESKGYDVSQMVVSEKAEEELKNFKKIHIISEQESGQLAVTIKFPFDKNLIDAIKEWKSRTYDGDNKAWKIFDPTPDFLKAFAEVAKGKGFDISSIEALIKQIEASQPPSGELDKKKKDQGVALRVKDVVGVTNGKWHLAFGFYRKGTDEGEYLKEIIKFSFPMYGVDKQRFVDSVGGGKFKEYLVKGTYGDYRRLHDIFTTYGFDTSEFDRLVNGFIDNDIVQIDRIEGDLDGYQTEYRDAKGRIRKRNDPEAFYKTIEDTYEGKVEKDGKIIDFKLYPEQKEGVAFLYGRKSAILGDETGVGKTVQMVIAADMRMRQDGGRTLVITVNDIVQRQWIAEIKRFTETEESSISTDPTHGKTWTVMTYSAFSSKASREYNVSTLQAQIKSGEIVCCLLDEIDSVKNTGSQRTKSVQSLTHFEEEDQTFEIPFVWGGTATVVANKPVDVYNQLKAINHPLGQVSFITFAKEFGGMVQGKYGWESGEPAAEIEAANKLKEWLINYGVYIQRTKKDIREDMPDQIVSEENVQLDTSQLYTKAQARMAGYKDPNLPISAMIAMRAELAEAKAPLSVQKLIPHLKGGKKVAVFTMFKNSSFELVRGLQMALDAIGEGGTVGVIAGGMHKKTKEKVITDIKNPNSSMRAIVITITAGGTGLDFPNVTSITRVNDFDWTPRSAEQSEGRFYRIITDHDVHTVYTIAAGTEDEDFYNRVQNKRKLAKIIQRLTQKQMGMIMKGVRRGNKDRKKVEEELGKAILEQIKSEQTDKAFMAKKSREIRNRMSGS